MPENDFDAQIDQIVKRAQKEKKREVAEEKAKKVKEKTKKAEEAKKVEEKTKKVKEKAKGMEEKTEKAKERIDKSEDKRTVKEEPRVSSKEEKKERKTSYTTVILIKLDYQGGTIPTKEQLAEELGRTIINWADQKKFYAISQKESVPELISVDIDVQSKAG